MSSAAFAAPVKSAEAFRTISEVAELLDVPQHVLRFWESRFAQIKPVKRAGGRRFYRPEDVDLLRGIRSLLYSDGFTIRGVQKILKDRGLRHVAGVGRGGAPEPHVVEKVIYVERAIPAKVMIEPVLPKPAAPKKRPTHLRAVPAPMSLPFFDAPEPVSEPAPAPVAMPAPTLIRPSLAPCLADEEKARLQDLLAELQGLKTRLKDARN